MTNAILSIATAAAIAIGSVGVTAPAAAANLAPAAPAAPAVSQSAGDLLTEVRHGKRHKGGFKRQRGKRGFSFHFGKHSHFHCFKQKRVWTKFGWRVKRVRVC